MGQEKKVRPQYQLIHRPADLREAGRKLSTQSRVAVDLEADSMYHFQERVCLVQLATPSECFVIDALKAETLTALRPIFSERKIRKIFHGADYDIRSLYRDFKIEVNNLFDTQLACRFLGVRETGLEATLSQRFNVKLVKKYQKKDWSQRPLPQAMLDYAAEDVAYLIPLFELLSEELQNKGRLAWIIEDCDRLSQVRPAAPVCEPLFLHFKGAGRLGSRSLAVLEALLRLRKNIAQENDKPLFKIFGNESLMKIAVTKPVTLQRLQRTQAFSSRQVKIYGAQLIDTVNKGLQVSEADLPVYPRNKAPASDPEITLRIRALRAWRERKAQALQMDPSLILSKGLITSLARHNPKKISALAAIDDIKYWQITEFGREVISLLN
ncbi:MAG: HRDC domain-containing protein [Desulfobacterales bacterium]